AAYDAAVSSTGAPTVVLAQTVKGYFLGSHFTARMAAHQMKKLTVANLKDFRDRLELPIPDSAFDDNPFDAPYYHPGAADPRIRYALTRRHQLGGFVPERRNRPKPLKLPGDEAYRSVTKGSGQQAVATTMAWVRLLKDLLRDPEFGSRIVPIVPDEARTFGMDSLFPTIKIYNPHGQAYTPVDSDQMLAYRESTAGQIIHTGINEAGSVAAFTAAGTSYATHGLPMVPMYIFYSMFGFQRTGDGIWAAADQLTRGFLIGATAGKTTLTGEGLQHLDGHSPLLAATNPAIRHYDPAYGYEIAHIMRHGLDTMYGDQPEDAIFYLTLYNEPLVQPPQPDQIDIDGIKRGMYLLRPGWSNERPDAPRAQILASGVAVPWALAAQELLYQDAAVVADVWSVTSWNELARDGLEADREAFETGISRMSYATACLQNRPGPVIAVSDFARAVPNQIAPWVPGRYATLGADGFGFSDTRPAARRWLKVDAQSITVKVLQQLAEAGQINPEVARLAYQHYRLDEVTAGPVEPGAEEG
ncbi:MAG: pyruvate dehydrogenase (acetyl-transferring), homodimeric type, partial [Propionibacteriaceae bacterium]|nr:pyruvate dehydrogenase (acetyl-transferring), homodimeric type [Propionibacteriaceae bacterium]